LSFKDSWWHSSNLILEEIIMRNLKKKVADCGKHPDENEKKSSHEAPSGFEILMNLRM